MPCIPPVPLVSPGSPGHGLARRRWLLQASSRRPTRVGPLGGLGVAWPCHPGALPTLGPGTSSLGARRASHVPCIPSCRGVMRVLCHEGTALSAPVSPLPPPGPPPLAPGSSSQGQAGAGLGWGSHCTLSHGTWQHLAPALSCWQFTGGTGSPVSACASVCLSGDSRTGSCAPAQSSVRCLCPSTPPCRAARWPSQPPHMAMSPRPCPSRAGTGGA